jgi:hypothetical protein
MTFDELAKNREEFYFKLYNDNDIRRATLIDSKWHVIFLRDCIRAIIIEDHPIIEDFPKEFFDCPNYIEVDELEWQKALISLL